jgi:hypothetical protein
MLGGMVHYHIRWHRPELNSSPHKTREEAEASARDFALPGETYTIEEFGEECPRCKK